MPASTDGAKFKELWQGQKGLCAVTGIALTRPSMQRNTAMACLSWFHVCKHQQKAAGESRQRQDQLLSCICLIWKDQQKPVGFLAILLVFADLCKHSLEHSPAFPC